MKGTTSTTTACREVKPYLKLFSQWSLCMAPRGHVEQGHATRASMPGRRHQLVPRMPDNPRSRLPTPHVPQLHSLVPLCSVFVFGQSKTKRYEKGQIKLKTRTKLVHCLMCPQFLFLCRTEKNLRPLISILLT